MDNTVNIEDMFIEKYWGGPDKYYTYGHEVMTWFSEWSMIPVSLCYLLAYAAVIMLSVRFVQFLFGKEQCVRKHYTLAALISAGLFSFLWFWPNIANFNANLMYEVTVEWHITILPEWFKNFFTQGTRYARTFIDNPLDYLTMYFTFATPVLAVLVVIFKARDTQIGLWAILGMALLAVLMILLVIYVVFFMLIPLVYMMVGIVLLALAKYLITYTYYACAYFMLWLFLVLPSMLLTTVIKTKIIIVAVGCVWMVCSFFRIANTNEC